MAPKAEKAEKAEKVEKAEATAAAPKAASKAPAKKVAKPAADGTKKKIKKKSIESYKVILSLISSLRKLCYNRPLTFSVSLSMQHLPDNHLPLTPSKIYLYKVLKQVHPDTGVSSKAMSILNLSLIHI